MSIYLCIKYLCNKRDEMYCRINRVTVIQDPDHPVGSLSYDVNHPIDIIPGLQLKPFAIEHFHYYVMDAKDAENASTVINRNSLV